MIIGNLQITSKKYCKRTICRECASIIKTDCNKSSSGGLFSSLVLTQFSPYFGIGGYPFVPPVMLDLDNKAQEVNQASDNSILYTDDFGICGSCFNTKIDPTKKKISVKISQLRNSARKLKNSYSQEINGLIKNIIDEIVSKSISPKNLCDSRVYTIWNDEHKNQSQKKKQIKQLLGNLKIQDIDNQKIFQDLSIRKTLVRYYAELKLIKQEIKKLMKTSDIIFHLDNRSTEQKFYHTEKLNLLQILSSYKINYEDFSYKIDRNKIANMIISFLKKEESKC